MGDFGSDFGSDFGYGFGYGFGSGSGFGYGSGSGYGFGDGERIGDVSGYEVNIIRPWSLIRVGCHIYPIGWWRKHWHEIARDEEIAVTGAEVERLLALAEEPRDG